MEFRKATKEKAKLRMGLIGPAGSGKTYSALRIASSLGKKIALIDTEHGSASKYADLFDFDTLELTEFAPANYVAAIKAAEQAGYEVLIIDSLSHAWSGKGGALEMVDRASKKYQGNSFAAWRDVTPEHNNLVETMIATNLHLIVTMRAKTEYVIEKDEKGKSMPRKVGLAPVQRDGMEYEFDIVGDMDIDNNLIVTKTRCSALAGAVIPRPGEELANIIKAWLTDGQEPTAKPTPAPTPKPTPVPTPAPKSTPAKLNWSAFWMSAKELGLNQEQVHAKAREFFKNPDLKSITEVLHTQGDLDSFLSFLKFEDLNVDAVPF